MPGIPSHRVCTKCNVLKPAHEFRIDKRFNILEARCKECGNAYSKRYAQTEKGRENQLRRVNKHNAKNPWQRQARNAARKLPKKTVCSRCGIINNRLHKHHHKGYDKEFWLDVEWLCYDCHKAVHYPDQLLVYFTT